MRILLSLIAVLLSLGAIGQIVDDSTKLVYGPKTTSFITEADILNNSGDYQAVDTSIYLFERQSVEDLKERKYQSLGSFGTPLFPVFHSPQFGVGRTSGFKAYQLYPFDPSTLKYYDTKSPYIELFVYLGGENRNLIDVGFSRNVSENWNIGFDIRKITTDKQLARDGAGDRQVEASSFVAYTHYKHSKIPYQVLFNVTSHNHDAIDLGGVRYLSSDSLTSELFQFSNALLRIQDAQTAVKTRRIHLYQDFQLADQFQLYHKADYYTEENTFQDFSDRSSSGYDTYSDFYPNFFIDADSTYQRATFKSLENEAGIKGDLSNIFYRAYVKARSVDFFYGYLDPNERAFETYIGGYTRFRWRDKFAVEGNGEYLLGGGYTLEGSVRSSILNVSYQTASYQVPFVYSSYFGNHHEWSNSFDPVFSNILKGDVNLRYKWMEFIPSVELTAYQNYLYFDEDRQPQQTGSASLISSFGGKVNVRFKNDKEEGWHLENEILYTQVSGTSNPFRIPELFYNGRIYWDGKWFKDKVPIQFGIDSHARSAYFANQYAPETQQFYLQNEFQIPGYYKADFFINMRLDKFFFSFKVTHFNQPSDGGYFATPYFPGQQRAIDLVVKWLFFD